MKSLEILEIYLKIAKEEMEEDKVKNAIINNLNQIKSDLEVLEIIKKKEINIQRLRIAIINTKDIEDTLLFYNCGVQDFRRLTLEELLKIKQWLEENENDR